jgi:hypothetical protein
MNSPGTSPPSSVDLADNDDDFTTALMREVAKKLGVAYDTKFRSASEQIKLDDGGENNRRPSSSSGPLADVLRKINLRGKALGENHPSLCELHVQAAEILSDDPKADDHLFMALTNCKNRGCETSPEAVNVLSKMGALHTRRGRFLQAQEAFRQAAELCAALESGRKPATAPHLSDNHLRNVLSKLVVERSEVANAVASSLPKQAPHTRTSDTQTDSDALFIPPPTFAVSKEQLSRLRSPALRSAHELKKLVSYVSNGEAVAAASSTKDALSKTGSPHFSRGGKSSMQALLDTLERVKHPVGQVDHFQAATQREVARILLEQYSTE